MTQQDDERVAPEVVAALHEAIANDTDFDAGPDTAPEDLDAILDCLQALEMCRREGAWSRELASETDFAIGEVDLPRYVGRFQILAELGRGGQGVVFLARDPDLGRLVAVKLPRPEILTSPDLRRRILLEAHAAATLNHPAIVAVHEIGEAPPAIYLVSDYCAGGSLQEYLRKMPSLLHPKQAARFVAELAAGVHYAHQQGVLHRDIKPGNVLLTLRHDQANCSSEPSDLFNQFAPKLTDFGLARLTEPGADRTRSGAVLGTPAYMAPEQVRSESHRVGPATDVYGLGVLLYEMLVGRPPFRGITDADSLHQVLFEEPTRPKRLRPDLSSDLEAICLCAINKDPLRRYGSAEAMANDLRRYLVGLPTMARPLSLWTRTAKWAKSRPTQTALLAVSVLTLGSIVVGAMLYERSSREIKAASQFLRRMEYAGNIQLAHNAYTRHDQREMHAALELQIPAEGDVDLREFTWHWLNSSAPRSSATLRGHAGDVYCIAWSPDGQSLVSGGKDGKVRVWSTTSYRPGLVIPAHSGDVNEVALFDSGRKLASGGEDGVIRIWDVVTGNCLKELNGERGAVSALVVSDAAASLACGYDDHTLRVWDTQSWHLRWVSEPDTAASGIDFSSDGQTLVTGHDRQQLCIWNVANGQLLRSSEPQENARAASVACGRGSNRIASLSRNQQLRLYADYNGTLLEESGLSLPAVEGSTHGVSISPVDGAIALGTRGGKVMICQHNRNLAIKQYYTEHTSRVWKTAWSPDGRMLASASEDGTIKLWNVEQTTSEAFLYPASKKPFRHVSMALDGSSIATVNAWGLIQDWNRRTRAPQWTGDSFERVLLATHLPNHELLVLERGGATAQRKGSDGPLVRGKNVGFCDIAVVSGDRRFLAISDAKSITVRDTRQLDLRRIVSPHAQPTAIAISLSGGHVATATETPGLEMWHVDTGELELSISLDGQVSQYCLAFTPDENQLAIAGSDGHLRILDAQSGKVAANLSLWKEITAIAISPDGRTLVAATLDPAVLHLVDLDTKRLLATLDAPFNVAQLEFAPDGRTLVAVANDPLSGVLAEWSLDVAANHVIVEPAKPIRVALDDKASPHGPGLFIRIQARDQGEQFAGRELNILQISDNAAGKVRREDARREVVGLLRLSKDATTHTSPPLHFNRIPGEDLPIVLNFRMDPPASDEALRSLVTSIEAFVDFNADQFFDPNVDPPIAFRQTEITDGRITLTLDGACLDTDANEQSHPAMQRSFARLVRATGEYARQHGFATGYPCGRSIAASTADIVLLNDNHVRMISVPAQLALETAHFPADAHDRDDFLCQWIKRSNAWMLNNGYQGALPTLHAYLSPNAPLRYEMAILSSPGFVQLEFDLADLKAGPQIESIFQEVHQLAVNKFHGLSAFPACMTYRPKNTNSDRFVVIVVRPEAGELRTVPLDEIFQAIGD